MKTFLFSILLSVAGFFSGTAQNNTIKQDLKDAGQEALDAGKQLTNEAVDKSKKEVRKAEEEIRKELAYAEAAEALKTGSFVMQAERVTFRRGETAFLFANKNFISMNDEQAVIQLAFNTARPTPNGIGGITVEGKVSGIKIKTSKKGQINYSFFVQGVGISAQVSITLYPGNNTAMAQVSPNFNSNRISLTGFIVCFDNSDIFKGTPF